MSISQLSTLSIKYYIKIIRSLYLIQIVKELIIFAIKAKIIEAKFLPKKNTCFYHLVQRRWALAQGFLI